MDTVFMNIKRTLKRYRRLARLIERNVDFSIELGRNPRDPHAQSDDVYIIKGSKSGFVSFERSAEVDAMMSSLKAILATLLKMHENVSTELRQKKCLNKVSEYIDMLEFVECGQSKRACALEAEKAVDLNGTLNALTEMMGLETRQGDRLKASVLAAIEASDGSNYIPVAGMKAILHVSGMSDCDTKLILATHSIASRGIPSSEGMSAWLTCLICAIAENLPEDNISAFKRDFRRVRAYVEVMHRRNVARVKSGSKSYQNIRARLISQRMMAAFDFAIVSSGALDNVA